MRRFLVANPVSGGDALPRIARAVAWLRTHGVVGDVQLTEKSGDAGRFAAGTGRILGELNLVFPNKNGRAR